MLKQITEVEHLAGMVRTLPHRTTGRVIDHIDLVLLMSNTTAALVVAATGMVTLETDTFALANQAEVLCTMRVVRVTDVVGKGKTKRRSEITNRSLGVQCRWQSVLSDVYSASSRVSTPIPLWFSTGTKTVGP
jgi:hypothetical protein